MSDTKKLEIEVKGADTTPQPVPSSQRGLNNPDPMTGQSAHQVEAASDEKFSHGEIVVQARREGGFSRGGYRFSGTDKTIIPANSLSKERYDAIINEKQLVAIEHPKAAHKKDAAEAVPAHTGRPALLNQGAFALGGSQENATPEMLEAADRGEAMGHPSFGSPTAVGGVNRALDADLEEEANTQREKRAKKEAKKAEKE